MNVNVFYQRGNTLFAGTSPAGVYKSADHGKTWSASNSGIADKNVFSLIANSNYLFAGTDSGVFRSPNNGANWQAANLGIEQRFIYSFIFANGYLFAGTSGGLYKSPDNGSTWSDANGNALNSSTIHDITYSPPHLVVISDNLIFYSDDNGDSWNYNFNSPFILGLNPSFLARHDSVLLASGTVVFRSFDGGVNWSNSITVTSKSNIDGLVQANQYIVAGTPRGMFYSSNFGQTWKSIPAHGMRNGNWFTHDFYRSGNYFLEAYDEIGVGYSFDSGKNWNYTLNDFTPAATIDNAMLYSNNSLITGTHGDGVYKSSNTGNTWVKIGTNNDQDTLSNSSIFSMLKSGNVLLAGACTNGLYRSADNGLTWVRIRKGLPQQSSGYLCVESLAKTTSAILIATDQGLYYSTDLGVSWKPTNLSDNDVVAVAANDSVACAAVENFIGPSAIYRSVGNPAIWNAVFQSDDADWASMGSDGKSHFYAGTLATNNFVSNNNGVTWQNVGAGIPFGSGGFTIAATGKNVFIGNINGVYFSNNFGASFTETNTGFDRNQAVQGLTLSSTDIYAGLFQNSVWKRPLSDFGITPQQKETNDALPVTIAPNPLINEGKLSYSITSMQHVVINLYDASGNRVRNILDAVQSAGLQTITIRRSGLRKGNYFISILAGDKHGVLNLSVAE
jgi:photosystem II stability/assembly factor-like uncharacterized protein